MKKCVIFCAGEFDKLAAPVEDAFVIAADGGYAHTGKLGLQPDAVLGDFDSLGYVPSDAVVHPVEKDDTDCMLAIRAGLEAGCTDFVIYGALDGPRLDHTLANLQSLQYLAAHAAEFTGTVSVFCMGTPARGVTIRGLKYELIEGELTSGYPLGVSNSFVGAESRIAVEKGCVLVLFDTANGMRWRYE